MQAEQAGQVSREQAQEREPVGPVSQGPVQVQAEQVSQGPVRAQELAQA